MTDKPEITPGEELDFDMLKGAKGIKAISRDAQLFLHKNPHLVFDLEDILIRIDAFLTSLNLEYEKEIYLRKDAEVEGWDVLKIKVKINKDLDEVLDIWEKATKEIYKEYDAEVRKKILLSFDTFE
jgi:hypothetical protein